VAKKGGKALRVFSYLMIGVFVAGLAMTGSGVVAMILSD